MMSKGKERFVSISCFFHKHSDLYISYMFYLYIYTVNVVGRLLSLFIGYSQDHAPQTCFNLQTSSVCEGYSCQLCIC